MKREAVQEERQRGSRSHSFLFLWPLHPPLGLHGVSRGQNGDDEVESTSLGPGDMPTG